jgi:hypothetical protein
MRKMMNDKKQTETFWPTKKDKHRKISNGQQFALKVSKNQYSRT